MVGNDSRRRQAAAPALRAGKVPAEMYSHRAFYKGDVAMPSLLARQQGLPVSSAPVKALAATAAEAAREGAQDENIERPSGREQFRIARRQGNADLGRSLAAGPDET